MYILQILLLNKFILGNWILRATNDDKFKEGYTFLIINDDNTIKLKTIYDNNLIVSKKSISGYINNISNNSSHIGLLDITYNNYNLYSHSLFGIQLPEIKAKGYKLNIRKKFIGELFERSLLIKDTKSSLYYLFDLQIGKIKSPYIETSLYTFIFTQFIGIVFSILIHS